MNNYPQFPLYIPSKGRSEYMTTSTQLTEMGVRHYIVVEKEDIKLYNAAIKERKLLATVLELDMKFKEDYEVCDGFGLTKSTGPGPARNFAWQHSMDNGHAWHWVMDDNILKFYRLNKNQKIPCKSPAFWKAMEDFCMRYKNVAMAGPNYFMFVPKREKRKPFNMNTRIYSCNLIRNDVPFKWRGRYNEDTILSVDMLKAGWCTIQFYAFLQDKMGTQIQKGGNTDEFYHVEGKKEKGKDYTDTGTMAKSKMMVKVHPDISTVVHRYSRVHHHVEYKGFKQRLIRNKDIVMPKDNNYGMKYKVVK